MTTQNDLNTVWDRNNIMYGCFTHATKVFEKNDVGFIVVVVGSPIMTKRNSRHFFQSLGHMTYCEANLDWNFLFLQK